MEQKQPPQRDAALDAGPKPLSREPAIGRIAVCSIGYLGIIEGRKELPWGEAWVGRGVITGKPWSSRKPVCLSEQDEAAVREAFGLVGSGDAQKASGETGTPAISHAGAPTVPPETAST